MGLQTVTWLLDGELVHHDSLLSEGNLRAGAVNVMTSGHAIAHAERTPANNTGRLSGVQLWTALPDADRHRTASFQHVEEVPGLESRGGVSQVFSGRLANPESPASHFSPIVGVDLQVNGRQSLNVPLEREHEHAVLVLSGDCALEGQPLVAGMFYYLGDAANRPHGRLHGKARVLLIGGTPFAETILMWWNFVARTPDEIRQAREDWEAHRRFGEVPAYKGPRLAAPALTRLAHPNPVS
jgi:redox-sensitive bicupin YhaK (pirin superfamily)